MAQAAQATSKLLDDHRAGKDISVKEIDDARATYNGLMKEAERKGYVGQIFPYKCPKRIFGLYYSNR